MIIWVYVYLQEHLDLDLQVVQQTTRLVVGARGGGSRDCDKQKS